MPVIRPFATAAYLPDHGRVASLAHRLMYDLIELLPQVVISAVNTVDGTLLEVSSGIVLPGRIFPWAKNAYDVWLDIQPDDIDGTFQEREARRYAIAKLVREGVELFLENHGGPRPSYDVECRPLCSSGISTNSAGVAAYRWGIPDDVFAPAGIMLQG